MQKQNSIIVGIFVAISALVVSTALVKADDGPKGPPAPACLGEYNYDLQKYENPTCKEVGTTIRVLLSDDLKGELILLGNWVEYDRDPVGETYAPITNSAEFGQFDSSGGVIPLKMTGLVAIHKNDFLKYFNSKTIYHPYSENNGFGTPVYGSRDSLYPDGKEFSVTARYQTGLKEMENLFSAFRNPNDGFLRFADDDRHIVVTADDGNFTVPLPSSLKNRELTYVVTRATDGKLILNKTKEIITLDDGSKKETDFPVQQVVQSQQQASSTEVKQAPSAVQKSWWARVWCFVKGLFGRTC
ncbi:MAG: hypothetical protein HZA35_03545 [Parcubacteria group bacterium]|nr:hypothetical protein [Parcubacteria group bacterium]